jgi:glycosyltransferase involved in cell wall biosynthesis
VNILFFFTYGTSLKDWNDSGYLSRELKFFKKMNEIYDTKYILITFGDESDFDLKIDKTYLRVIPIYKYLKRNSNKLIDILNLLFGVKNIIKELNLDYDLIRTNQLYGAWLAIFQKFISRKPLIIRTGYDLFVFSVKDKKNILKIILYYILTFVALNCCNLYTVTSNTDYKFLKNYFLFKKSKLKIRSNWVEVPSQKISDGFSTDSVLAVGRLETQKDYKYLINIFNKSNFELHIVGSGMLEDNLKTMSEKNIKFFGNVEFEKLNKMYHQYRFYVTSTNYEGNPKALLEAMANGCIVIAPQLSNIMEIITNNKNGITYDKKRDDILQIINEINKKPEVLKLLSENAQKHVQDNNSLDLFARNESKDYELLIDI